MRTEIESALRAVTVAADQLTVLVETGNEDQRRQIIGGRRDLSQAIFDLGRIVEKSAQNSEFKNSENYKKFRTFFDEARRAIALHQAEWPVSGIARDQNAYVASARRARDAKDALVNYVRHNMLR
jgi:hypothetical protein